MTSATRMTARLLAMCTVYRWAMGLALGIPLSLAVARVTAHHPRSDAVLWEPGGYWLAEIFTRHAELVPTALTGGGVALMALSSGWLLALGALIAHLGDRSLGGRALAARAAERFAPLTVMYGLTLVGQLTAFALALWLGKRFATLDRSGDVLRVAVFGGGFAVAAAMAVGHDAARVVCVQQRPDTWGLINRTFELLRARPGQLLFAAAWRGALAWLALVLGVANASQFLAGGSAALAGALALQILAIGTYVGLRASWLQWLTGTLRHVRQSRAS